jgi:hypothetical protein
MIGGCAFSVPAACALCAAPCLLCGAGTVLSIMSCYWHPSSMPRLPAASVERGWRLFAHVDFSVCVPVPVDVHGQAQWLQRSLIRVVLN